VEFVRQDRPDALLQDDGVAGIHGHQFIGRHQRTRGFAFVAIEAIRHDIGQARIAAMGAGADRAHAEIVR